MGIMHGGWIGFIDGEKKRREEKKIGDGLLYRGSVQLYSAAKAKEFMAF